MLSLCRLLFAWHQHYAVDKQRISSSCRPSTVHLSEQFGPFGSCQIVTQIIRLDDLTIEALFGAEDAENETVERFRQYFYFNKVFDNLNSPLPIRILVGHKGIGKSALLRRAYLGDEDASRVAVWIRPSDLTSFRTETSSNDFNLLVEQWRSGLLATIGAKVIEHLSAEQITEEDRKEFSKSARRFIAALGKALIKYAEGKVEGTTAAVIQIFLRYLMPSEIFLAPIKVLDFELDCAVMYISLFEHRTNLRIKSNETWCGSAGPMTTSLELSPRELKLSLIQQQTRPQFLQCPNRASRALFFRKL